MSSVLEKAPHIPERSKTRPLRVLLVTQVAGGGAGRHFADLAQQLTTRGVEVTGIHPTGKLDAHFSERLSDGGLPPMHALEMRRAVGPHDAVDLYRLARMIRLLGPFDIIHGHSSKGGALARLAARYLRIPSVYTPHAMVTLDPTLSPRKRRFYAGVERWLGHNTAAVIAVSHDEAEHIRSLGIDADRIHVVPNGIDLPEFPAREEVRAKLGFQPQDLVVGFIGRMASQKAPDVLIDAFALAAKRTPNLRLLAVGSGPLAEEMKHRVTQHELTSRVSFLGDVVATSIIPAMDLFCLSSRYEGMPYVLLEALAAGLPIVSTRVGGVSMCVEPDGNGQIVPPDDVAALAEALCTVATDSNLRHRYGAASAALSARFTATQMADQTLQIYRQVVAARNIETKADFLGRHQMRADIPTA